MNRVIVWAGGATAAGSIEIFRHGARIVLSKRTRMLKVTTPNI